ncbi:MAG: hypothetical protein M0Q38_14400 [Bacteroidales bacterium]|jgi:hypothetical protein|nr:hypothetical protein [Bacteroidales bacterium]
MKTSHLLILLIIATVTYSCTKEGADIRLSEFETPVINGYYLRNDVGQTMGVMGFPNVKLGNESNDFNSTYFFACFPNPCRESCAVYIKAPTKQQSRKLWITQANIGNQVSNSATNIINMTNIVIGASPVIQIEFTSDHLTIDLSSLKEGYYRIYLKVDEFLLYDNLVIYKPGK